MLNSFYRYLSLNLWGNLPSPIQRRISRLYASIYDQPFTRYIIKPYCRLNYNDPLYLDQFRPASASDNYLSFQDFFCRVYKELPHFEGESIWPCEGLLCDYGQVKNLDAVNVKADVRDIKIIFGDLGADISENHFFSNVFLHNYNYHRIHAPVNGRIEAIEHIEGDLVLLHPWVYKNAPPYQPCAMNVSMLRS